MNDPLFGWQPLAPGTLLASRYRSICPLKVGGMGAVYLARDDQAAARSCVVDFGIARVFSPIQQHTIIGTAAFCPPEQYQGRAEPLSDLYALAASLH